MDTRAGRAPDYRTKNQAQPAGRTFFLGIGVNTYEHWNTLSNAVGDVEAIVDLLQQEFGLETANTTLLFDKEAGEDNIIHQLERLAYQVEKEDSLLIYYAGHGHLDEHKNGFWIPADGPRDRKNRWIRNSTLINDYVAKIKSLHTLLIADSCYSGSLFSSTVRAGQERAQELMRLRSRWAICSGRGVVTDGKPGERSPFAQSILDALGKTQQEYITAGWLLEQVAEQTRTNYDQLPDGGPLVGVGHERGQYVFQRKKLVQQVRGQEEKQQVSIGGELAKYNCDRRGILDCFWDHFRAGEDASVPLHLFFLPFDRDQMSETLVHRITTELHLEKKAAVKWSGFDETPIRDVVFSDRSSPERQLEILRAQLVSLLAMPEDCPGDRLVDFLEDLASRPNPNYQDCTYLPYVLDLTIPEKLWAQSKKVIRTFIINYLHVPSRTRWVPVIFITLHLKLNSKPEPAVKSRFLGLFSGKETPPLDAFAELEELRQRLPEDLGQLTAVLPPLRSIDEDDLHDWSRQFRQELSELERIQLVERIIDKLPPTETGWPMKIVNPHLIRVCEEIKNTAKYI